MNDSFVFCVGDAWARKYHITKDDEYISITEPAGAYSLAKMLSKTKIPTNFELFEPIDETHLHTEHYEMKQDMGKFYAYKRLGFKSGLVDYDIDFPELKHDKRINNKITVVCNENKGYKTWVQEKGICTIPDTDGYYIWASRNNLPTMNEMEMMGDNSTVLTDIKALRKNEAFIPSNTSWERKVMNCIWQITANKQLRPLNRARLLIINFDFDGALIIDNMNKRRMLWYYSNRFEGDTRSRIPGNVPKSWDLLVAWFVKEFYKNIELEDVWAFISDSYGVALTVSNKCMMEGYRVLREYSVYRFNEEKHLDYLNTTDSEMKIISVPKHAGIEKWEIVKSYVENAEDKSILEYAKKLVIEGYDAEIHEFPILEIGKLITANRFEIERYMNIKGLILNYVNSKNIDRPLCMAVFGKPGNGKSFGITEIACNISNSIKKIEFNLSQFKSIEDLYISFQKIRDIILSGKIPLVFFDEFDNEDLKWLKYFLMPMQDGCFIEKNNTYHLGRCIFIFAGGLFENFQKFSEPKPDKEVEYKQKKVPDFISRLRGYINIQGVNYTLTDNSNIIRRSMILRSLIMRKIPRIVTSNGIIQIDKDVLNALLNIKEYKHNVRSMEAIIDMCQFGNKKKWEQSCLPSRQQMQLHVDSETFMNLVFQEINEAEKIERIAEAIYVVEGKNDSAWISIPDNDKKEFRLKAKMVDLAMQSFKDYSLYYNFDTGRKPQKSFDSFKDAEIGELSKQFHGKLSTKWIDELKFDLHEHAKEWDNLSPESKSYYVDFVMGIPDILKEASMFIVPFRLW